LEQPATAAVIQGSRHARHIPDNVRTTAFSLDADDYDLLTPIFARSSGPLGDTYDLDREENRDALENISTEYFDVENGSLVTRQREGVVHGSDHELARFWAQRSSGVGTVGRRRPRFRCPGMKQWARQPAF